MNDDVKEELKECYKRIDGLVKMLTQRFIRSSPIEEELMAIGVGKRDLPTREECKQWAIKLGVPEEFQILREGGTNEPTCRSSKC